MSDPSFSSTHEFPTPSATSVAKSTGKTKYTRGIHPVKQMVNGWVVETAVKELGQHCEQTGEMGQKIRFALLLETGAAQTVDTILKKSKELGITAETIVVPNPDKNECEALSELHPTIITVPVTSHELLRSLSEEDDGDGGDDSKKSEEKISTKTFLKNKGFKGNFDLVWLDYCGTFNSKPGRRRQEDLKRLFDFNMLPKPALIVVTAAQRGAITLYFDEIADMVLGFVKQVVKEHNAENQKKIRRPTPSEVAAKINAEYYAKINFFPYGRSILSDVSQQPASYIPRKISCAGVAIHNITSRIYTVAMVVDRKTAEKDETISTEPNTPTIIPVDVRNPDVNDKNSITIYNSWHTGSTFLKTEKSFSGASQFFFAQERIAEIFAGHVARFSVKNSNAALIMDNKLLQLSSTLVQKNAENLKTIYSIIPDQVDITNAEDVLHQFCVEKNNMDNKKDCTQILMRKLPEIIATSSSPAVFMSYEQTMSAADLLGCDKWTDINKLCEKNYIGVDTVLGLHIRYSETALIWKNSHVDWLVEGMRKCVGRTLGLDVEVLTILNFTVRAPHVVLILRIVEKKEVQAESSDNISQPNLVFSPANRGKNNATPGRKVVPAPNVCPVNLPPHWSEMKGADWQSVEIRNKLGKRSGHSTPSEKYLKYMKPWLLRFLNDISDIDSSSSVMLHEPGFNHLLPDLLNWLQSSSLVPSASSAQTTKKQLALCAACDAIQHQDLLTRAEVESKMNERLKVSLAPNELRIPDTICPNIAILLCDGGNTIFL